jgi:hemolysin III
MENLEHQSFIEELANSITHGIGLALSIIGFVVMEVFCILQGTMLHIIGCTTFGVTLILLYTASTLYHSFRRPHLKRLLKILDHAAIYLLIAGTYTPFTLVNLRGFWGWTLLATIWTLALLGVLFKLYNIDRFKIISPVLYILMGWSVIIVFKPLVEAIPTAGLVWLLAGGLFYTFGVAFFACKRIPYNHAIWHLFVMAGSICHYFAVFFYVLPA